MKYYETHEVKPTKPGCWNYLIVSIHQVNDDGVDSVVGSYERQYSSMGDTFFPFEQSGKWYALYSANYEATEVMELPSCKNIATLKTGFCPVAFYVPGKEAFNTDGSMPKAEVCAGQFGFVSGCYWGDDCGGWKCQYIDLSKLSEGVVTQDERLGYFELPYKTDLKDCFDFGDYYSDELFTVKEQFMYSKDSIVFHSDLVIYGHVGDSQKEAIDEYTGVPSKILASKLADLEDRYATVCANYWNLGQDVSHQFGDAGKTLVQNYRKHKGHIYSSSSDCDSLSSEGNPVSSNQV